MVHVHAALGPCIVLILIIHINGWVLSNIELSSIDLDTCHSEYPELALSPDFVLMQQKWQEHEQPSVMDYPPDVNVPLHPVQVAREPVDALGHQDGQLFSGGNADGLWRRGEGE